MTSPDKIVDMVISFDTTGSMFPCLDQVRRDMSNHVRQMFSVIPNLRVGIIAHGDYCDERHSYVIKHLDLSSNLSEVESFIRNVGRTGGGDAPECYELALHYARTKMSWRSGASKICTLIGDDIPHGPEYPGNIQKIDWRNELGLLLEAGINVYGIHALHGWRRHSKPFYQEIANRTGGFYLTLDQFSSISDVVLGIVYKQGDFDQFQNYVDGLESNGRMDRSMRMNFGTMGATVKETPVYDGTENFYGSIPRARSVKETRVADIPEGLKPVPPGRFQVMYVGDDTAIKAFVESRSITFKKGRGFYELTKPVDVQPYKEIVLREKETGDFFYGSDARKILGLQPQTVSGGITERLKPVSLDKYQVFIQSTSVNRKLLGNTSFLYEVEDIE